MVTSRKTKVIPGSEWRDKLVQVLVQYSEAGIRHTEILHKFQAVANAEELTGELEGLWKDGKVDQYSMPTKGKHAKIWRATNLILK